MGSSSLVSLKFQLPGHLWLWHTKQSAFPRGRERWKISRIHLKIAFFPFPTAGRSDISCPTLETTNQNLPSLSWLGNPCGVGRLLLLSFHPLSFPALHSWFSFPFLPGFLPDFSSLFSFTVFLHGFPSRFSFTFSFLIFLPIFFSRFSPQAEQQKKAAVISAEGDSKAAELIANSLATAGDGLIELRKLEAAEDIAYQLSRSRNITYLPSGQSVLLQLPQ
ncbi:prohibitin 1 isoform X2 [Poecile atricapillus]|uniref:prohibitin 1 isoform X2 n=1 Tax=Poecile atricapillus TaxID=48891 RepID=UPI00273A41F7|nr:prohibitin 1 isoform X2 [Poecile atricapillus]